MLDAWHGAGRLMWIRLSEPSVTGAMNLGLLQASMPVVLFLDDDIEPGPELITQHRTAHSLGRGDLVAGKSHSTLADGSTCRSPQSVQCAGGRRGGRSSWVEIFPSNGAWHWQWEASMKISSSPLIVTSREFADRLLERGGKIHYCGRRGHPSPSGPSRAACAAMETT